VICGDCLEVMKDIPDNSIYLVLTDPPYGIDIAKNGFVGGENATTPTNYGIQKWDKSRPSKDVFNEVFRISKNQAIFGGNYFLDYFYPTPCIVVWDKGRRETNFADCEIIWTSFNKPSRIFAYLWDGMRQENMKNKDPRWHPTQKPLGLVKRLIESFTQENDLILDPFLGSGTTAVAAKHLKRNFIGIEISPDYCKIAEQRLRQEVLL